MHNNTGRRINSQRCCIYNTVIGLDKFNPELPKVDGLSELHNLPLYLSGQVVLLQLILDQTHRQSGRINRYIDLL